MVLVLTYIGFALIPDEALDGVVAERVKHTVIHDERCEVFPPLTVPTALEFIGEFHILVGVEDFARCPAFYRRAAPSTDDDADRHAKHAGEHLREIPC